MVGPQRTCIVCRATAPVRDLVRIAWPGDADRPVVGGPPSGRGAWVHPTEDCVSALRAECLSRALRRAMTAASLAEVVDVLSGGPDRGHMIHPSNR
ncbi:MAG: YlxR family protein [Actinomycetota bacterium]|nr:YlxR family protein [Actinomycetota bacterium]MEC9424745.1 YlxR family protein [Actinomycetota bacterium]MED5220173.1 YlxR family protein [Actinomycetota bacterium]